MDEARIDRAMHRIEAALMRVEKAATGAEGRRGGPARDDALRERVASTLTELDELIAELQR